MVPLLVLVISAAALRGAGFLGVTALNNLDLPLRGGLFLMFMVTASARWGSGRADLIRMVPSGLPRPDVLVSVTGVLEILGALGLLISATTTLAAVCLSILLVAMFPANVRAARERLTIFGRPAPGVLLRGAIQAIFLASLIVVAARGAR
jgi:uncharacterized membrane protein